MISVKKDDAQLDKIIKNALQNGKILLVEDLEFSIPLILTPFLMTEVGEFENGELRQLSHSHPSTASKGRPQIRLLEQDMEIH